MLGISGAARPVPDDTGSSIPNRLSSRDICVLAAGAVGAAGLEVGENILGVLSYNRF